MGPPFLTEFGAIYDEPFDLYSLDAATKAAAGHFMSWTYWQYKYFEDITTSMVPGSKESFFEADGSVQQAKVDHLSTPYFYAICGNPKTFNFDPETKAIELTYEYT